MEESWKISFKCWNWYRRYLRRCSLRTSFNSYPCSRSSYWRNCGRIRWNQIFKYFNECFRKKINFKINNYFRSLVKSKIGKLEIWWFLYSFIWSKKRLLWKKHSWRILKQKRWLVDFNQLLFYFFILWILRF